MDSKKLIFIKIKLLSIALCAIGWSQTATAQYNLQLDSVITEVVSGTISLNSTNIVYEVPHARVWKIEALFGSGPGNTGSNAGWVDIKIVDSKGKSMTLNRFSSNNAVNVKVNTSSNSFDSTGIVWLNEGCKIIFVINGAASNGFAGSYYRGLLSALQFSTQ